MSSPLSVTVVITRNQNSISLGLSECVYGVEWTDIVQGRAKTINSLGTELRFRSESDTSFYS